MRIIDKKALTSDVLVQLGRVNGEMDYFSLTVEDKKSGLKLIDIKFYPEAIADLVSTRMAHGEAELFPTSAKLFGKTMEMRDADVPMLKPNYGKGDDAIHRALAFDKWEKSNPGWTVDRYYSSNKYDHESGTYLTHARRWV